jgi:hypothetical protein
MSMTNAPDSVASVEQIRKEWLARLSSLVTSVETWATELGWSARQIEKQMKDSQLGTYRAPALIFQEGTTRIMLEPIAHAAPGAEGVVDLYLMPAYDDIASLYFEENGWQLHYMFPNDPTVATIRDAKSKPLTKASLQEVLAEMTKHGG